MKLIRSVLILVFACTAVAWSQTGTLDDPALDPACQDEGKDPVCRHAFSTLARFRAEHEAPPLAQNGPATTDVAHCFLDLELHFDTQTVSGTNTVTFRSLSDNLTTVSLDLDGDNMSGPLFVDAVTMASAPVYHTRAGGKIDITLDRPYAAGESFAIAVTYHGSPQNAGYSSFTWVGHGGSVLASTLSEPWHASTWWPCRDELVDKFTMDMWLTVPAGMVGVSNGSLEGTDALPGNRLRYRWRESYPIVTYLVSLAVTNYVSWSQYYDHPGGSMPVVFYAYPESQSYVQANVADVLPAIQTFSQAGVYGEYPFVNEKYGIAQFAWSGGMEHQTITSQGAFIWWLNVHELAHQWWGDMVTCATWHDIWLNEGFASFSEALYEEKRPGGSFAAYKARMQARRPASMGGSVYVYNAASESAIFSSTNVYNKGAWAVHMLRHVLGDEAFFETLAAYRAAYEGGSATTDEFKAVAEFVYGASLDWYFNEWIYGTGAPSYRWGWRDLVVEGQHRLALHVEQYQTHYDNFRMPIDITVTAGGSTRTHVIWQEHDFDWYALEVDGPVSSVHFDKDVWILREITSNVTYVPPPRLTATAPALGSAGMYLDKLDLTFSTGVMPAATDFSVTGSVSGNRAFTLSQPSSTAARLNFSPPLPGGEVWTVTVRETLSATSGLGQFDGEIADPANPGSLPSGNGLIGGDAVFTFSTAYPGDFDNDLDVDLENFGLLQRCLLGPGVTQTDPQCRAADINHDSFVDGEDLAIFQACLSGPGQSPPAACGI